MKKLSPTSLQILKILSNCPFASTDTISMLFDKNGSPSKRASEHLKQLEKARLLAGQQQSIGKPKLWRLTQQGRKYVGIEGRATSWKVDTDHFDSLAAAYTAMMLRLPGFSRWMMELREPFGVNEKYCADAFFVADTENGSMPFFLEIQVSPKTEHDWSHKWERTEKFFRSDEFRSASFQYAKEKGKTFPSSLCRIIVISPRQQSDTILANTKLPVSIFRTIDEFIRHIKDGVSHAPLPCGSSTPELRSGGAPTNKARDVAREAGDRKPKAPTGRETARSRVILPGAAANQGRSLADQFRDALSRYNT